MEDSSEHQPTKKEGRLVPDPPPLPKKKEKERCVDTDPEVLKLRKFRMQIRASEGFDCDETPSIGLAPGGIRKVRCDEKKWPTLYEEYTTIAKFAIEDYNQKNKTEFVVSKIESVNMIYGYCAIYFMTFTAENVAKDGGSNPASAADSASKIFQAKVCARLHGREHLQFKRLEFCRLKKTQSEK